MLPNMERLNLQVALSQWIRQLDWARHPYPFKLSKLTFKSRERGTKWADDV